MGALGADFAVGLGECVFGIECTFSPGGLSAAAAAGDSGMGSVCAGGLLDQGRSKPSVRRAHFFVGCFTVAVAVVAGFKSAKEPVGQARQVGWVEAPVTLGFTPVVGASLRHQTHSSQRVGRAQDATPLPEGCQIETLAPRDELQEVDDR